MSVSLFLFPFESVICVLQRLVLGVTREGESSFCKLLWNLALVRNRKVKPRIIHDEERRKKACSKPVRERIMREGERGERKNRERNHNLHPARALYLSHQGRFNLIQRRRTGPGME